MKHSVRFEEFLQERIAVFDGAMGTSIQKLNLSPGDFGGTQFEGCNEHLALTRPDVIGGIHRRFLDAGADVIETNTFGSTPLVLAEYGLHGRALEVTQAAADIARQAADEYSTANHPRFVAGSMGPTTKCISVTGGVTFAELIDNFHLQAKGLILGGVDLLLLETCQDTRNIKAGIIGINKALEELNADLPIMVSGTIEPMGTMLAGQGVEALYASMEHARLLAIGLNCATGPRFMTDHIRSLAGMAQCAVSCIPNAGLPDEEGRYNETPSTLVSVLQHFVNEGWVNILGGCCGTAPEHIAAIAQMAQGKQPRQASPATRWHVSGIDYFEFDADNRPAIVGERTNVIGSRMFKRLIAEGKFEEASEIGRKQSRSGAQILDVCLADPDRDETEDLRNFLDRLVKKVKSPLMIDSTDAEAIETALQYCQGKSIINSINLEDGEERFKKVVPIAKRYGAALIVGCIDEDPQQGMAVTAERKLAIAKRSYDLLVNQYGVRPQDIIFDPLVFPCATGDKNYIGSAEQTILGVKAIKKDLPNALTILGVSNVSFGLPPAGREILNAVFLYHCTKAGLDLAIVNSEKLERYANISAEERKMAEDLLFNRGDDPASVFAAFYKDKKTKVAAPKENRTLEERLAAAIVEANKEGLADDLDEAMQKYSPLQIINGPLMAGMDEVGRQFGANELIVAEVLQSAEVMKAAVAHLEPFMQKSDAQLKGTIVLATVKGDVHDIGKNLVDIILSNNGFKVVNLGIKIPPEELIKACREHQPDIVGLSGLLVKSAQQMSVTAQDLRDAGVDIPLLVGGAALTNRFTRTKIAPQYGGLAAYASDAMSGLALANKIIDEEKCAELMTNLQAEDEKLAATAQIKESRAEKESSGKTIAIRRDIDIPAPPDFKLHILKDIALDEIFPYINQQMLLGKHLGLRGPVDRMLADGDEKALELQRTVRAMQDEIIEKHILQSRAVFRFFPVRSEGDAILILDSNRSSVIERFDFPRQTNGARLCLSDFVSPNGEDCAALFAVSCGGQEVKEWSEHYKKNGDFLKCHMLQSIAIESAEALAEWLHEQIRRMWGFPDSPDLNLRDRFHAKYRGLRVSFGYPACPRMEDQALLFSLLDVEKNIGVRLTDGYMMEPESSVSALVFHHPDARYFTISEKDMQAFEERQGDWATGRLGDRGTRGFGDKSQSLKDASRREILS
ncbi:MAG: methionine synthase [Candidatus Omnitrophota bacterium]